MWMAFFICLDSCRFGVTAAPHLSGVPDGEFAITWHNEHSVLTKLLLLVYNTNAVALVALLYYPPIKLLAVFSFCSTSACLQLIKAIKCATDITVGYQ
jgi:hypothetical protein